MLSLENIDKKYFFIFPLSIAVILFIFSPGIENLLARWDRQQEYSHGYFMPVLALFVLWHRRSYLLARVGEGSWAGPILMLLACILGLGATVSKIYIFAHAGLVLAFISLALSVGGWKLLKPAFIPILFLLFMIPLPYSVGEALSLKLQMISSHLGVAFIRAAGISVHLFGNVIDLGAMKLQVAEACNGLRYLFPLMSLGFIAAYFFKAPLWQKAIIFLTTIPIAVFVNSFRIGLIGVMVENYGIEQAEGALHFFEGWVLFGVCLAMVGACIALFAYFSKGQSVYDAITVPKLSEDIPQGKLFSLSGAKMKASFGVIVVFGVLVGLNYQSKIIVPDRDSFEYLRYDLEDLNLSRDFLNLNVEDKLRVDDYFLANAVKEGDVPVNMYFAYYEMLREGGSWHSPQSCIPGGGWYIAEHTIEPLDPNSETLNFNINKLIIKFGDLEQVVYYWYQQRGRFIAKEMDMKMKTIIDGMTIHRTDGALVRFVAPVPPKFTREGVEARMLDVIEKTMPHLDKYIPRYY